MPETITLTPNSIFFILHLPLFRRVILSIIHLF
jgi:hypothetical protein